MITDKKIAIIGYGVMGKAIVSSLIGDGKVKLENLIVVEPTPDRLEILQQ